VSEPRADRPGERPPSGRRLPKGLAGTLAVTALLALYVWQIAGRGIAMMRSGEPVLVGIGLAVLIIPLLVIGLIVREYRLAATVQTMADTLFAEGDLPVDDLPRSPGGRIDRSAADQAFEPRRTAVEAAPEDWRAWYHLAFAYDAAGDRRRAREALRKAAGFYRARPASAG
jgi:tetratricopeptide (TPR) repeat protein